MIRVIFDSTAGHSRLEKDDLLAVAQANKFLDAVAARGLTKATVRAYAYDLLTIIRWLQASDIELAELTPDGWADFLRTQREQAASPRSINRRLTTLRIWYRYVVGDGPQNSVGANHPAPHYKGAGRGYLGLHARKKKERLALQVRVPRTIVEPLSPEQVAAFFRSLRRYRDLGIAHLMLFCGLRSSEVRHLHLSDVNAFDRCLRVHGKGNRQRIVPVNSEFLAVISDYRRLERPMATTDDHLFVVLQGTRRGQPMTAAGLRRLFRYRRASNALLANANAHRFRHTFGTDMARSGMRLPILQKLMGHGDAKTTLQYINLSMADVAAEYHRALASIANRYEMDGER